MKNTGIQKYKTLITIILMMGILLTACSSVENLANQVSQLAATQIGKATATAEEPLAEATSVAESPESNAQATQASQAQPVVIHDESLDAYEEALTQIYEGVNPSMVSIISTSRLGHGQGSGFVWDLQGHIVTNHHVIDGAEQVKVEFYDGTTVDAEVIGSDVYSDLAVLKVEVAERFLQPVQMADSDEVKVGQLAIAIGNPFALSNTMTVGIVSAVGRVIPAGESGAFGSSYSIPDIIQTDAPINPGNSGGVLVNDSGQVIGVTNAIESTTNANAGIGFAIPSNIVSRIVPVLIQNGKYEHPYLGITGTDLSTDLAEAMDLDPEQRGALVVQVTPNGPADKAGIRGCDSEVTIDSQQTPIGGDVVTAINDHKVLDMDDLISYLYNKTKVGQTVTLTILRDGKEMSVDVVLEARPAAETTTAAVPFPEQITGETYLGITGVDLTSQIAEAMDLPTGQTGVLVQRVQKGSPADDAGLRGGKKIFIAGGKAILIGGDVITAIDDQPVNTFDDLSTYIQSAKPGDQVKLSILRDGKPMKIEVTLGRHP